MAQHPTETALEIKPISTTIDTFNKSKTITTPGFNKNIGDTVGTRFSATGTDIHVITTTQFPALRKISVHGTERLYEGRSLTEYYLENEKLIGVHRHYINATRMGSCGAVEFDILLFFHDGSLIGMEKRSPVEGFFASCYQLVIVESQIEDELSAVLRTIEEYRSLKNN